MTDSKPGLEKAIKAVKMEILHTEQEKLQQELRDFLHWLEPMVNLDTGEAEEILFAHEAVNVLRKDRARQGALAELQEAAPNFAGGFYLVPRIIE